MGKFLCLSQDAMRLPLPLRPGRHHFTDVSEPFDVRAGGQPAFDYVSSLTQPRDAATSRNSRIL